MEINPKLHAQTKRKKFQSRRDFRYGGKVRGHSVNRCDVFLDRYKNNGRWGRWCAPNGSVERQFSNMPGRKAHLMQVTGIKLPFEEKLGIHFGKCEVSINKKRRWETIPDELEKMKAEARAIYQEHGQMWDVYGFKDDWTVEELASVYEHQQKVDASFEPTWVKDRLFFSMQKRKKKKQRADESWPKHLIKYDRLRGRASAGTKGWCRCVVYGQRKWANTPSWTASSEIPKDYLQYEFLNPCEVVAIGTKGRGGRFQNEDISHDWVTKYRLQYKLDDGKYVYLGGIFSGNSNLDDEAVRDLVDPQTGKRGIVTRGLRIIPVASHGMKVLRVAFYGREIEGCEDQPPDDVGLRAGKYSGTVVRITSDDVERSKSFARKTKSAKYSPDWFWSKPRNVKEARDAMTIASGGYEISNQGGMPELRI